MGFIPATNRAHLKGKPERSDPGAPLSVKMVDAEARQASSEHNNAVAFNLSAWRALVSYQSYDSCANLGVELLDWLVDVKGGLRRHSV